MNSFLITVPSLFTRDTMNERKLSILALSAVFTLTQVLVPVAPLSVASSVISSLISDKSLFISEFYIGLGGDMVCPPHHYSKIPLDNFNILFYTIGEK